MPAVTADTLRLPRIAAVDPLRPSREVLGVVDGRVTLEGEGFQVRRPFPGIDLRITDPFILLDQLGAVEYAPGEAKGAPDHPHRGFETVTYVMDGAIEHRDSTGGGGLITDGATQWMTAGSGILHIETPPEQLVVSGGLFHGIQLWVNLPSNDKFVAPRYQSLEGEHVTLLSSEDGGALIRVVAGDVGGHAGPGATHTPITFVHATIAPGARLALPWRPDFNALVYALSGSGAAGAAGHPVSQGQLVVFGAGDQITVTAGKAPEPLEILVLGGRPIREPVAAYGPFVMNTQAELAQAFEDFKAGRLGTIPADALMPFQG